MSALGVDALLAHLWPEGDQLRGQQVYMLVDGACDSAIAPMIRHGKLEWDCLFSGPLTPRLQAAAPYLVHLAHASALTRELLTRGWAHHWGMLMTAPADVTQVQLRQHFKKFLRVRDEDGAVLAFRFYDPRVLRVYLPSCTGPEARRFLGPLSSIVLADAGGVPLTFSMQSDRLRQAGGGAVEQAPAAPRPDLTQLLAVLALGRPDADTFAQLRRQLPAAPHAVQEQAMAALAEAEASGAGPAFELGLLAADMQRWQSAAGYFATALRQGSVRHAAHVNLGLCWRQLGRHDDAERHLLLALDGLPGNARYAGQLAQLRAHRQRCRAVLDSDTICSATTRLSATLLGRHHAGPLLRRLDATTARQARLPLPAGLVEARRWLREQQTLPMAPMLAVLHPVHGLIGAVGVEQRHNAALFHFWIGGDFQGQGYGHAALDLLLAYARRAHIHRLYSAVAPANVRSQSVLRRAGFQPLRQLAEAGPDGAPLPLYFLALDVEEEPEGPDAEAIPVAALRHELELLLGDPASVLALQDAPEDGR